MQKPIVEDRIGCYASCFNGQVWFFNTLNERNDFVNGEYMNVVEKTIPKDTLAPSTTCCVFGAPR